MTRRALHSLLVLLAVVGAWALYREHVRAPASIEAASTPARLEHPRSVRADDSPAPPTLDRPAFDPSLLASTAAERQRLRLRDTAADLTARRNHARATAASAPIVQALDAHIARIEHRLAAIDAKTAIIPTSGP